MNILVVGGGGREHALVWKLAQSRHVSKLYCAPGNAGIQALAECLPIAADDLEGLKQFALSHAVDLTVVGPEGPLALGLVDEFRRMRLKVYGPTRAAAQVEASKAFSKDLMLRSRIPTPRAKSFERATDARDYARQLPLPWVIKADGLAQGKGVVIASTAERGDEAISAMLEQGVFGAAGRRILIEEYLEGEEATLMAFTDGKTVIPMVGAQDHKRINDGDTGPNTGGMGAYAPAPVLDPRMVEMVMSRVFQPAVEGLSRAGCPFQGTLYAGLMIVREEPYVLEFNARFGDPETQVVLPLLKSDLAEILLAVAEHRLDQVTVSWHPLTAVCVVLASGGYPGAFESGRPVLGLAEPMEDVVMFHAGTKRVEDTVVTAGGRVLGVTGLGPTLRAARDRAYKAVERTRFEGRHFRTDIALRALAPC